MANQIFSLNDEALGKLPEPSEFGIECTWEGWALEIIIYLSL